MSDTVVDLREKADKQEKPKEPEKAAAAPLDPNRSGTFRLVHGNYHIHQVPPVLDGQGRVVTPAKEVTVTTGGTFTCSGGEAAACRADTEKFQEI